MEIRYQNVNSILTQDILSKENWIKINKIILQNKKSKIWRETANKNRITEDFKNYIDILIIIEIGIITKLQKPFKQYFI